MDKDKVVRLRELRVWKERLALGRVVVAKNRRQQIDEDVEAAKQEKVEAIEDGTRVIASALKRAERMPTPSSRFTQIAMALNRNSQIISDANSKISSLQEDLRAAETSRERRQAEYHSAAKERMKTDKLLRITEDAVTSNADQREEEELQDLASYGERGGNIC